MAPSALEALTTTSIGHRAVARHTDLPRTHTNAALGSVTAVTAATLPHVHRALRRGELEF